MTDTNETAPATSAPIEDAPAGAVVETDWKARAEAAEQKLVATTGESRKWEGHAKADKDAAASWRAHEQSLKTQEQQTADAVAEAKAEAAKSASEAALLRAAVKHGISEADLDFLAGTPAELVEERAAKFAARIAGTKPAAPRPDPSQGSKQGDGKLTTAQQFAAGFDF